MNTTMRWLILALVIGLVWEPGVAGTVLGTEGRKCYPTTYSIPLYNDGSTIFVYGNWIENIDRATSPSGVTVTIISKKNGAQNNSGPFSGKGEVSLRIKTNNASPGTKTINLINDPEPVIGGGETFSFTITVVASPSVTSVNVPTPADPFNEITVTLNGTGLQEARDPASGAIVIDNLIPFITVGGNASVSNVRVLSSSATSLQAKISFSALIQDATVELSLVGTNKCVPLGVLASQFTDFVPFKTRVRVKSSNIINYVESITFPTGNTFDKNSTGTINLNLLFAAPPVTRIGGIQNENSLVFFKFVPPNAFAKPDGTPFQTNTGGFIGVRANQGEDIVPITFKVIDCLGGQAGQTNAVSIETWMHTTNTNLPPNKVVKTFSVRCIQ